jgi:hypothetical protein
VSLLATVRISFATMPRPSARRAPRGAALAFVSVFAATATPGLALADDGCAAGDDEPETRPPGVAQGVTKLSTAFEYAVTGSDHVFRIGGEFEHMLRNRWGLVGSLSIPVSGEWVATSTLGVRLHALPRSRIDPFVGSAAGFAWVNPAHASATLLPMLGMRAGISFFSTGPYFVQAEGGYDFVKYSHGGVGFDLGGPVATVRAGFSF